MERKGIFDSEVLEKVFESDNEKYASLKRFLARIIHRYLKSNPKLCEGNNQSVYQKSVQIQAKYLSAGHAENKYVEMIEMAEWLCDMDLKQRKRGISSDEALQIIMDAFLKMT